MKESEHLRKLMEAVNDIKPMFGDTDITKDRLVKTLKADVLRLVSEVQLPVTKIRSYGYGKQLSGELSFWFDKNGLVKDIDPDMQSNTYPTDAYHGYLDPDLTSDIDRFLEEIVNLPVVATIYHVWWYSLDQSIFMRVGITLTPANKLR